METVAAHVAPWEVVLMHGVQGAILSTRGPGLVAGPGSKACQP